MSEIQAWDPSAINNQQPAPDGWPENTMTVAQVNDAGREMMAALARWYLDTNGSLVSAGTGAAYTVTPNRTIAAYFDGLVVAFEAHTDNTGAATLALPALAAKDIRLPDDSALIAGDLQAGGKAMVVFDASTDHWQLVSLLHTRPVTAGSTPQLTAIELGHASDTTLSRSAAGVVAVEGKDLATTEPAVNAQTGTSYTLVLGDKGKIVTMSNAGANTLTVPPNASVSFPTGTVINVVQLGAGVTTITGGTGVTLNGVSAGSGDIQTQYQGVSLLKIGTDTWVASGDIGAVS